MDLERGLNLDTSVNYLYMEQFVMCMIEIVEGERMA